MKTVQRNRLYLAALALTLCSSCAGKDAGNASTRSGQGDQALMDLGRLALEDKKWEAARDYFRQLLDTYPRSQHAGDARLGVADSYFNQRGSGNRVLSIAEYRDFLTFFPNHPRADYAQYQIALAYYDDTRSSDRDQTPTREAIEEFEKLTELYRNSLYAEEGRKLLVELHDKLASHEFDTGLFYLQTRKSCRAAISRFKTLLEQFPQFARKDEVFFQLGESYRLCRSPKEAMPYYQQVIDNFPASELSIDAKDWIQRLEAAESPKPPGEANP